jgi:hypothetical protein
MAKRRGKRRLKKYLRKREGQLNAALVSFLADYDFSLALNDENPTATPESEKQFRLLLRLRWLVYDYLWVRLKIDPRWRRKQWFLELFDVDEVRIENENVYLTGDIVWWAEGEYAQAQWWPEDHAAQPTGIHKLKIRGDLGGGKWVVEPMTAWLRLARTDKHNAGYRIEFGYGSTCLKTANFR